MRKASENLVAFSIVLAAVLGMALGMLAMEFGYGYSGGWHDDVNDRLDALETPTTEQQLPSNLPGN